jgi:lysophospholipase L1-like esterase
MNTRVDLHRYDNEIKILKERLRLNPPEKNGILFYGSSTMAFWRNNDKCYRQMAPLPVINNGFGGATSEELLYYYQQLVFPVKPSVMVYYGGANDLEKGYAPSEVIELTHRLFEWSRQDFPGIQFLIIPVKLSPGLERIRQESGICNGLFEEYAQKYADTRVLDISSLIYDSNGKLRMDIYVEDMIHHNEQGYEELAALVKPTLKEIYSKDN